MDYSYIFRSAKIKKDSLEAAGFTTTDGNTFSMNQPVSNRAFNADITLSLSEQTLTVLLFPVPSSFPVIFLHVSGAVMQVL